MRAAAGKGDCESPRGPEAQVLACWRGAPGGVRSRGPRAPPRIGSPRTLSRVLWSRPFPTGPLCSLPLLLLRPPSAPPSLSTPRRLAAGT